MTLLTAHALFKRRSPVPGTILALGGDTSIRPSCLVAVRTMIWGSLMSETQRVGRTQKVLTEDTVLTVSPRFGCFLKGSPLTQRPGGCSPWVPSMSPGDVVAMSFDGQCLRYVKCRC